MRMKRQNRKGAPGRKMCPLLAFILATGIILCMPPLNGAAWAVELDGKCALQVAPVTEGASLPEGQMGEKIDVTIDLYLVAEAREVSGYDTYDYFVGTDSPYYAGIAAYVAAHEEEGWEYETDAEGLVFRLKPEAEENGSTENAGQDGSGMENGAQEISGWAGLARTAASAALTGETGTSPAASGEAGSWIEDLNAGLYLAAARGSSLTDKTDYVTQITTAEGGEETATIAYSREHVYQFIPQLVSLPAKDPENGSVNTAGTGEWIYRLSGVELKPIVASRYTSLEIVKALTAYAAPAAFVFQVEASQQGRTVYSDVVTISFDGSSAGAKSVLLEEKIPVGSDVTVTEIYSGAGYELTGVTAGPGTGETQEGTVYSTNLAAGMAVITSISAENGEGTAAARVTFTNDYNNSGNSGSAITNHFERDGAEADWNWNQYRYSRESGSWGWNPGLPAVADTTVR